MRCKIHTRQITFSLPEADFETIRKITDEKMISIAQWIRGAIELKLERDENQGGREDDIHQR